MATSTPLARMRLASKLCRSGAWIIAVMGLAVSLFFVISNISSDQSGLGQTPSEILITFAVALIILIPIFFFFLILFAVGALLDYISAEKNAPREVNDERVEIISLP